MSPVRVVGLRCPISETAPYARGVPDLAAAIASRAGAEPRLIGSPTGREEKRPWSDDLAKGRGCLLEAGGQVEDALGEGWLPVLVHGDCAIGMATLPTIARTRPDARVLWLDAHGDFNTPETTPSGWLGGMGLAGGCGRWDSGLGQGSLSPERLVLCGVRALDEGERQELERSRVTIIGAALETLVYLQNALDGAPTYVHLDPDVLDPSAFPAETPADGGLPVEKLYDLLDSVADSCEVLGLEVAAYWAPSGAVERCGFAQKLAEAVEPLLTATVVAD